MFAISTSSIKILPRYSSTRRKSTTPIDDLPGTTASSFGSKVKKNIFSCFFTLQRTLFYFSMLHQINAILVTNCLSCESPWISRFCTCGLLRKPLNAVRVGKRRVQCNPKFDYNFLGDMASTTFRPNYFWLPTSIFNHFHNKVVSALRNIHSMKILYTVPPNNCFSKGKFCLCVENVMSFLDPFLFISSYGVGILFTYKVSDVILGQKRFAL